MYPFDIMAHFSIEKYFEINIINMSIYTIFLYVDLKIKIKELYEWESYQETKNEDLK